jgi:hypothetical protein
MVTPTHTALLNTIGPFLLFSNTWSSLKIYRRHNSISAALKSFSDRAARFVGLIIGLGITSSFNYKFSKQIQKLLTFSLGAGLHYLCQPFHWTLSLYFFLRATGLLLVSNRKLTDWSWPVALVRHPACIFLLHCCHNYFLTHRADCVSPHYLKLWTQVLPIQYNKLNLWLNEFKTSVTRNTKYYLPEQCGRDRLKMIPKRLTTSLKRQLPLVAATFIPPVALFKRSTLLRTPFKLLWDTSIKIVRSSLVLTILPFLLTEFPCLWGMMTNQPPERTVRQPLLHTVCVSLGSTAVFF